MGQKIECQACGASSFIKHKNKSLLECEYCGAMTAFNENSIDAVIVSGHQKPVNLVFLLVIIPVLVIVLMVVFWFVFQNIRKHTTMETYETEKPLEVIETTTLVQTPTRPVITGKERTSPSSISIETFNESELLTIQSQVSGVTTNGGKYWILGVKNSSNQRLSRPGVMLSLFNQEGQRIEEQGGWSLREVLKPEEQTAVLLFLSELPADAVEQQLKPFASKPSQLGLKQVEVTVANYSVTTKNKTLEIVGDVINEQNFKVKYVRVMAVAYDADGKPIGIGNAFSTDKDLESGQNSGFKVKVGTFLQGEPVTWGISALGRH